MAGTKDDEEIILTGETNSETTARVSLCRMGKLWTDKTFNANAMINIMRMIWNLKQGMEANELSKNLFIIFQFHHGKDKQFVMENALWHFDRNIMDLKEVQGSAAAISNQSL